MTQDQDDRLASLLIEGAPPARDPVFRIQVLERRERQRFQQRSALLLAAALAFVVISLIGVYADARVVETAGVLFFGVALAAGYVIYGPALVRRIQRFRV